METGSDLEEYLQKVAPPVSFQEAHELVDQIVSLMDAIAESEKPESAAIPKRIMTCGEFYELAGKCWAIISRCYQVGDVDYAESFARPVN